MVKPWMIQSIPDDVIYWGLLVVVQGHVFAVKGGGQAVMMMAA